MNPGSTVGPDAVEEPRRPAPGEPPRLLDPGEPPRRADPGEPPRRPDPGEPPRRPDASMDLLNTLREEALDPSYAATARTTGGQRRRPGWILPALVAVGLILGLAVADAWRTAPAASRDRAELIQRIEQEEQRLDELRARSTELQATNREMTRAASGLSADQQELVDVLGLRTGEQPVRGQGVRVTLDDGADANVRGSRVVDTDLRMVANSLWESGAEAVAINGHRLSVRTAIRNAGDAITVDYRSVTRPYVVEAIGDPRELADLFGDTEGGQWVRGLAEHYGVTWELATHDDLTLPSDPGLGVDRARAGR